MNTTDAQLRLDWETNALRVWRAGAEAWDERPYDIDHVQPGYSLAIGEAMYVDELRAFLDAVAGRAPYPHDPDTDHNVLRTLYALEQSDREGRFVELPFAGPAGKETA